MLKIKDKRFIVLGVVLLLLGALYAYKNLSPYLYYQINENTEVESAEQPLDIYVAEDNSVGFSFTITAQEKSLKSLKLLSNRKFTSKFPFIDNGSNLTLLLEIKEVKELEETPEEERIPRKVYELTGGITNLQEKEYKIRVEDNFGNLIDEKTFKIEGKKIAVLSTAPSADLLDDNKQSTTTPGQDTKKVDPMIACETVADCVAVDCGCSCSGCGGFSYDKVVNKKYEAVWYFERNCKKSEFCPEVCCKPAELACENSMCVVKEAVYVTGN